jgi:hypothetical protein
MMIKPGEEIIAGKGGFGIGDEVSGDVLDGHIVSTVRPRGRGYHDCGAVRAF